MTLWKMLKSPNFICGTVLNLRAVSASAKESGQGLPRNLYMDVGRSSEQGTAFRETFYSTSNVNDDVKLHFRSACLKQSFGYHEWKEGI